MPFGVRKYPGNLDPRTNLFLIAGFDWGAYPPYLWELNTSGAVYPYDDLNFGVVCQVDSFTHEDYQASITLPLPLHPQYALTILGFDDEQPLPFPWTVSITLTCIADLIPLHTGVLRLNRPYGIQVFTGLNMTQTSGPINYIPNPVSLTPVKAPGA